MTVANLSDEPYRSELSGPELSGSDLSMSDFSLSDLSKSKLSLSELSLSELSKSDPESGLYKSGLSESVSDSDRQLSSLSVFLSDVLDSSSFLLFCLPFSGLTYWFSSWWNRLLAGK
jgi:uncharacterized protein YjbI with pentapeptide repeats